MMKYIKPSGWIHEKFKDIVGHVKWSDTCEPLYTANDLLQAQINALREMAENFRITTWGHSINNNEMAAGFLERKADELEKELR